MDWNGALGGGTMVGGPNYNHTLVGVRAIDSAITFHISWKPCCVLMVFIYLANGYLAAWH